VPLLVIVELASSDFDIDIDARVLFIRDIYAIPDTRDGRGLTRVDVGNRSLIIFTTEFELRHRVLLS
jgi:hypothetical protein